MGRSFHAATVLTNGKVLVSGSSNNYNSFNSSELYDPSTGSWTIMNSMNYAWSHHTASILYNGQVLVAGSFSNTTYPAINSAELY